MTLKELRQQSKKTATEVAKVLGVTTNAIYQYENGKRRICLENVLILAKFYDVSEREVIESQLNSCQFDQ